MSLRQLLLGSMLGDGCVPKIDKGAKNNRFSLAHSLKQECYFMFKYNILKRHNLTTSFSKRKVLSKRYKNGYYEEIRFKSKSDKIFTDLRKEFYPEGKKIIPPSIEELNEFGLAIWFMDDGFRTGKNLKGVQFSTDGFTLEEVQQLKTLLNSKWGLDCTIRKNDKNIYVKVKSVPKLLDIISPYIPQCMWYKVLYKSGELQERKEIPTCSQANDASLEGSQTTGDIGSLNNQLERPTHAKCDDIVDASERALSWII